MKPASVIANYFIKLASNEDERQLLTHMHVHKLLYYAQGWALAWRDRRLFDEPIEAWRHGPVVRTVWDEFKGVGDRPLSATTAQEPDDEDAVLVRSVWESYKKYSASELRNMTHEESPWLAAWGHRAPGDMGSQPIDEGLIHEHFQNLWARHAIPGIMPQDVIRAREEVRAGQTLRLADLKQETTDAAL